MTIRLLLVDDQDLFREGLRTLLSIYPDLQVVAEAGDGEEALRQAAETEPDIVLMDLHMPVLDGVSATRRLRQERPSARVIILTTFDDDEHVFEGLRAGAVGYLLKDVSSEKLVEAIRATARGDSFLQPNIAAKVVAEFARLNDVSRAPQPLGEPLSEREMEILTHLAGGATNKEIAAALFIAEGTVKNHISHILAKLDARDRTQAALRARDLGLL